MRSGVFRVDNYPAAADFGSLSSVTGNDKREREGKPDFWPIVSVGRGLLLRLGTLAKRRKAEPQLQKDGIGL